jgi:hypothetical protein
MTLSPTGYASQVLAIETVRKVASTLGPLRIDVLPLKGAVLVADVFGIGGPRVVADVDLLLADDAFDRGVDVLLGLGYAPVVESRGRSSVTLMPPEGGLMVDLHREPLIHGLFRLPSRDLFGRGHRDSTLFGAEVIVPAPLDLYAHLVGHFAKGRLDARDAMHLRDFGAVGARYGLSPTACARHLAACGMARAARYVLSLAAEVVGDPHALATHGALPTDRLAAPLARASRAVFAGGPAWAQVLAVHALAESLPRGARSFAGHAVAGARDRIARRLSRFPSPSPGRR